MEMDQSTDSSNRATSLPTADGSDVVAPVENVTIGPARTKPVMKVDPSGLASGDRKIFSFLFVLSSFLINKNVSSLLSTLIVLTSDESCE